MTIDTTQRKAFEAWVYKDQARRVEWLVDNYVDGLYDAYTTLQPEIDALQTEIARLKTDREEEAQGLWRVIEGQRTDIERLKRALIQITTMNTKSIAQPLMVIHGIAKDALAAAEKE